MTGDAIRGTGVAAKCAEIGDAVAQLRLGWSESDEKEKRSCKTNFGSRFHGEMNALLNSGVQRRVRVGKNKIARAEKLFSQLQ